MQTTVKRVHRETTHREALQATASTLEAAGRRIRARVLRQRLAVLDLGAESHHRSDKSTPRKATGCSRVLETVACWPETLSDRFYNRLAAVEREHGYHARRAEAEAFAITYDEILARIEPELAAFVRPVPILTLLTEPHAESRPEKP